MKFLQVGRQTKQFDKEPGLSQRLEAQQGLITLYKYDDGYFYVYDAKIDDWVRIAE